VITPRPGWQNRLLPVDPFLMRGEECKPATGRPDNFFYHRRKNSYPSASCCILISYVS